MGQPSHKNTLQKGTGKQTCKNTGEPESQLPAALTSPVMAYSTPDLDSALL